MVYECRAAQTISAGDKRNAMETKIWSILRILLRVIVQNSLIIQSLFHRELQICLWALFPNYTTGPE
jgi:hypothetical protein